MPFWRFTWLTALGSLPWVVGFGLLGRAVGDEWEKWREHLPVLDYLVVAALVALVVYWLVQAAGGSGDERRRGAGPSALSGRRASRPGARSRSGIVQGPAELLPVSSSAHIVLVPWLAGWDWDAIDPEVRKSFEVALHTGAAAALLIGQRRLIVEELHSFDARRALLLALSFAARGGVGYGFERQIEERLGGPRATAFGLLAGAARCSSPTAAPQLRGRGEATPADGLALGVAQAAALAPGVSRNGVTLAAARWRRFSREQANLLSRTIALPIIVGATGLKGARLAKRGTTPRAAPHAGGRDRRLLRLHPRLAAPDRPGRARPRALALRGLPRRPRRRGPGEAARCIANSKFWRDLELTWSSSTIPKPGQTWN